MEGVSISRIYDLKTIGVQSVLSDIASVDAQLTKLAATKKSLGQAKSAIYDPAILTQISNQLGQLTALQTQWINQLKAGTVAEENYASAANDVAAAQKGVTVSMQESTAAIGGSLSAAAAGISQQQAAVVSELELAKARRENAKAALDEARADKLKEQAQVRQERATRNLTNAYSILNEEHKKLIQEANHLGIAEGTNSEAFIRTAAAAEEKRKKLLAVDLALGNARREVGKYNQAGFAMAQILRETPAFAYSFATGIMAISNNLPILIDEITRLRVANAALKAEGAATIPVWKTMISSIFSLNGLSAIAIGAFTILAARWHTLGSAVDSVAEKYRKFDNTAKEHAATEMANAKIKLAVAQDEKVAWEIRLNAVKALQDEYPNYLGNLSQESILAGDTADEMERLNKALLNKALMEASIEKVSEQAKAYIDLNDQLDKYTKKRNEAEALFKKYDGTGSTNQYAVNAKTRAAQAKQSAEIEIASIKEKMKAAEEEMKKYQNLANQFGGLAAPLLFDEKGKEKKEKKEKKGKQAHDYTNEIIQAEKQLTDATAKEAEVRIMIDMAEQKAIFSNLESSLTDRLKAYSEYYTDEAALLKIKSDAEIQDVQAKLDKIKEIELKPKAKRTVAEQNLFLNKEQLEQQLKTFTANYELGVTNLANGINANVAGIVKSGLDKEFETIDTELARKMTNITNKYNAEKESVYRGGGSDAQKDKKIAEISRREAIEKDEAALLADRRDINAAQIELQTAHDLQLVELEAQLRNKLVDLYRQEAEDKAKLQADSRKHDEQDKQLRAAIQDSALSAARSFADAYIETLAKQDAYRQTMAQRNLEWNTKVNNATAQSKADILRNEKAQYVAEQQLARQVAEDNKKRAISQATINMGLATTQVILNTLQSPTAKLSPDGGLTMALIAEGAVVAAYIAQIAAISAAPAYEKGIGSHPGGLAWVGDGGVSELVKIGSNYFMTPDKPTLTNLPAGSSVTPPTTYTGTMGNQLQAPKFSSTSSGGVSDMEELKGMFAHMIQYTSSIKVVQQDANQIKSSINKAHYKRVQL